MKLQVDLAGHTRSWSLLHGARVEDWIANRPWYSDDRVVSVLAPAGTAETLSNVIHRVVRSDAAAGSAIAIVDLAAEDCESGFERALAGWLRVDASSRRLLCERLGSVTDRDTRLFVAELSSDVESARWVDDARAFFDTYGKIVQHPAAALVVLVRPDRAIAGSIPTDVGWPVRTPGSTRGERWGCYVHERVAWHCGGHVGLALELGGSAGVLAVGSDTAIEQLLDDHACGLLGRLDPERLRALRMGVTPHLLGPMMRIAEGVAPTVGQAPVIAPWLARALLIAQPEHPQWRSLRSVRTCRPLANRLLGQCMDLEQAARDRILASGLQAVPPEQAQQTFSRIVGKDDHIEHQLAPKGRADVPSAWDCAPFAEIVRIEPDHTRKRWLHRLRETRNALAHGAEVGWNAMTIVERLVAEEGRSIGPP